MSDGPVGKSNYGPATYFHPKLCPEEYMISTAKSSRITWEQTSNRLRPSTPSSARHQRQAPMEFPTFESGTTGRLVNISLPCAVRYTTGWNPRRRLLYREAVEVVCKLYWA
jgi:hypothetical protein